MTRTTEIEILAATLEEPAKALLRAALVAQRQGRLDASARVAADQVEKRPTLAWAALLLALDAAELRLGGSVKIESPKSRFEASDQFPLFKESWGPFTATVWPAGIMVVLQVKHSDKAPGFVLIADPLSGTTAEAVTTIAESVEAHFGRGVKIEGLRKKS
jgi:hypothetical protein